MSASHGQPSHGGGKRNAIRCLGVVERVIQNDPLLRGVRPFSGIASTRCSATRPRVSLGEKFDPRGASTPLPQSGGAPQVWGEPGSHRSGFWPGVPVRVAWSRRGRAGVWGVRQRGSGKAARRVGDQISGGRE